MNVLLILEYRIYYQHILEPIVSSFSIRMCCKF